MLQIIRGGQCGQRPGCRPHLEQQAAEGTMRDYATIDADGHVRESIPGLREFLEPRWRRRNLFPSDEWHRDLHGKLGQSPNNPQDQLAAMDEDGIDVMVLYPTAGLAVGRVHELEFA